MLSDGRSTVAYVFEAHWHSALTQTLLWIQWFQRDLLVLGLVHGQFYGLA